ncbi:MAG: lipoyl synthase [Desulfuromonadales bacterium]|nr:lipoyl synthase [Desulfuromonadales bacterium]
MKKSGVRKPDWLKVKMPGGERYRLIDSYHREKGLHTVCRSAACPNQAECWGSGTATFMILGDRCSRNCAFCNVLHDQPRPIDPTEVDKVAAAVADLKLRHAVFTSVTRDDLPDGGAACFAALVAALRIRSPACTVELLIPDLQGDLAALQTILASAPDILGHNIETVPRLYTLARQGADYRRSLRLLAAAARLAPAIQTKSGLMLGMGEEQDEVAVVLEDLITAGCRLLTLGQYLQPTRRHLPVKRYLPPEEFELWRQKALALGFRHVESGPLVRSSYRAEQQFQQGQKG